MSGPRLGSVDDAIGVLRAGRSIGLPTETVYGLGVDARSDEAVRAIYRLKGRPPAKPLTTHVPSIEMARGLARNWPEDAERLAQALWPGPLTIVVERGPGVCDLAAAGGSTIGLRMPNHPMALEVIERFGGPVAAPSANASGQPPPTTAQQVIENFPLADLIVLDGGACPEGASSTVLALAERGQARILREGPISTEMLERLLGRSIEVDQ